MDVAWRRPMIAALFVFVACSSTSAREPRANNTGDAGSGAALGSCVEQYSLDALAKRSFAFDGTVRSVQKANTETGADQVTFDVGRGYKGGTSTQVTLKTYGVGGVTSAGSIAGRAGERMLVTGEGDTLWTCGFTQTYSEQVAADWEAAFSR